MVNSKDRNRLHHPPPSLSQPTFSSPPAPAVNPPLAAPVKPQAKGKAKIENQSVASVATAVTPRLPGRLSGTESSSSLNYPNVQLQAPVRWVYNYDHTDPLNFGFMFPVTPSSPTDLSILNALPMSSSVLSPAASAATHRPTASQYSPAKDSPGSSTDQSQWSTSPAVPGHGIQQIVTSPQQNSPGISDQHQELTHQNLSSTTYKNLPHRYSPNHGHDLTPSFQQFASPEEQIWFFPPYGTSVPEEYQESFVPDSRGWFLDGSNEVSSSFVGPASTGPLLTPQPFVTAAPLKRKRNSDASSTSTTPPIDTVADMRRETLCSRCKIYEKLSGFPGLCSSCLQVSFVTWPSTQGTRNEGLESLVLLLMPTNMEEVLVFAPPNIPRRRTWRMISKKDGQNEYDFGTLMFQDRWTLSKQEAESTRLFGEDYAELANIAQTYQRSLPLPNKCLEASCTLLITICELYKSFVEVSSKNATSQPISIPKLLNNIRTARITIRHAFQQLQMLAVSPSSSRDRQDWFPAFLSACIMAVAAVIFLDILIACPSPYKEQIWGTYWHSTIVEMRNGGYGMLVALLKANSNGVNPLKMDCWTNDAKSSNFINVTPDSYSPVSPGAGQGNKKRRRTAKVDSEKVRPKPIETEAQRERDILLGFSSPTALQGVIALRAWYLKYHHHLKQGEDMFSKSLYNLATMKPVAGLWRIFELE